MWTPRISTGRGRNRGELGVTTGATEDCGAASVFLSLELLPASVMPPATASTQSNSTANSPARRRRFVLRTWARRERKRSFGSIDG